MNGVIDVQSVLQECEADKRQTIARPKPAQPTPAVLAPANGRWALYRHRWTSRRTLLSLTDEELHDIGLDYTQARIEAAKPFWRP